LKADIRLTCYAGLIRSHCLPTDKDLSCPTPALRHASLGAFLALLFCSPVRADLDIGALSAFSSDSPDSPIPKGLVLGGPSSAVRPVTSTRTTP
jgi:hypothetical protein